MGLSLQVEALWLCGTVCLHFWACLHLAPLTFHQATGSVPFQDTDLFWTLGLGVLGVAEKSVKPSPTPDSPDKLENLLVWAWLFSPSDENHILSLLSDTHHDLQKAVGSNHPEIFQVSFRAVWKNIVICFVFCFFQTKFCVWSVIVHVSSRLCAVNQNSIFLVVADECHECGLCK